MFSKLQKECELFKSSLTEQGKAAVFVLLDDFFQQSCQENIKNNDLSEELRHEITITSRNLKNGVAYIRDNIASNDFVAECTIREINALLMKGTIVERLLVSQRSISVSGEYRKSGEKIRDYLPVEASQIPHQMRLIVNNQFDEKQPFLKRVFSTYKGIVLTQPFPDMNKRTANLMMNLLLIKEGYAPFFLDVLGKDEITRLAVEVVQDHENQNKYYEFMIKEYQKSIRLTREGLTKKAPQFFSPEQVFDILKVKMTGKGSF